MQWLEEFEQEDRDTDQLWQELWQKRNSGQIKLRLIAELFRERKSSANLFSKGKYLPIKVIGAYKENILAFVRKHNDVWYLTAVPLNLPAIYKENTVDNIQSFDWKDTALTLPEKMPGQWQNVLFQTEGESATKLSAQDIFAVVPFALLKFQHKKERALRHSLTRHFSTLPVRNRRPGAGGT